MSYSFNELEMNRIQSAAALCSGGGKILLDEGNWVPLYTELSKLLQEKMESGTLNSEDYKNAHNAKLWLDVAIGANGKTGMHNAFIRTYTQRQGKLRTGTNFSEKKMQLASNGVAFNLYKDLIKYKYIPSITDIAKADASSIGENLFGDILDPSDTAVLLNSAWAGTIGFNLLGGATPFETWRLLSGGGDEGATASLNSLMDIRDLLFAADSYTEALKAAYIQGGKDVLNTIAEFAIRSADPAIGPEAFAAAIQPLVAQLNIMVSSGDLTGCLILVTKNTPKVREFFELYKKFSKEEILDMLRGAIQGKTLIGNTTPENYDDVAYNFFNSLSVEKLNSTSARLLPADKSALIEAAKSDTNIRVALGSLSYIAIQTEEGVREKFSLYNDMTGEGHITEEWIRDRVEMLSSLGDSPTDSYYLDQSSNTTTGSGEDTRSVIFGSENGDTQNGGSGQDKLYGGMGNDTQTGGQGNDYLEGGDGDDSLMGGLDADTLIGGNGSDVLRGEEGNDLLNGGSGNDVYKFYGSFGSDLIIDSSGNDSLEVQGFIYGLPVGKKIKSGTGNTYQSDDGQVTYFLLQTGPITDLVISFEGKPEKIRIRNFDSQTRNFGITLEDTTPVEPPVNHVFTGDFIKSNPSGDKYLLTDDRKNYVSAGQQESAQDVINGTDDKDSIFGLGGNDGLFGGDGADFIDGGEGSDLILGGTGQDTVVGNAGHDFIFGSATRGFSLKTDPDSPPPTATGLELARGFNWVAYNPPGVDERGTDAIVIAGANTWALNDAGFVESTGNFIDGGTGEDYIAAGTGKDTVYGGADNDSIWGMGFGDVVFGDDGNDQIRGDGSTIDYIQYTPAEFHGDDILDGGSGNDTVVGQGGADEIYGGTGDDVLLGDDDQFDSTPASVHDKDNVYGGEGNDQLFGGGADDQLFGGTGNDSLWGDDDDDLSDSLKGNDLLDGEEGDDQLIGGAGNDTVIGGAGKDKMWGDFNAARYENSIATGNDHLRGDAGDDTVIGGAGNDMLFGGADNDLLIGDDGLAAPNTVGNDTLHGEAGNDTLEGWAGDDLLDGGVGKDHLYGDAGTDSLTGGSGDDFLYGEDGDDSLIGGEGTDGLEGGSGNDTYILNAGDSPISTLGLAEGLTDTSGKNKVVFGSGVNLSGVTTGFTSEGHLYIQYTQSDLLLVVGATKQTLRFEFQTTGETLSAAQLISRTNADTVQMTDSNGQRQTYGSSSSNTILARSTDLAYGGQGSDLIIGSESGINVLYSKGDGEDRIQAIKDSSGVNLNRLAFDQGVNASDLTWSIKDNTLRLSLINNNPADAIVIDGFDPANAVTSLAIDQFLFSDGNVLTAAQLLSKGTKSFGTTAADIQQGSIGNDTFVGSGGDDTLKGWQGSDTYAWSTDLGDDVIDDGATSAVDIDVINASEEIRPEDVALNQFGNDLLIRSRLGGGTIRVVGQFSGTGIEQLTFANGVSWDATYISTHLTNELTESADNYSGNASDNVINARGGNDMVRGNDGNDYIEGGAGNDSLFGNNQNDTLIGGLGTDSLNGGTGDDVLDGRSDSAADTLVGGAGSDTYLFGRGGGIDITDETGATTSDVDVLKFDSTVKPGDLIVSYNGGAFKFSIAGTTDAIWARMSMPERTDLTGIKRIEFESGGTWSISDVRARVIANASTPGNDSFNAFDSDDVIDVRAGNDGVYALGGNDYVDGGAGNDTLMGDSGNDTLIGGAGTDTLYGGDGNDELIDGENLWGGKGNDTYRITSSTEHRVIYEDADVPENVDVLYLPFASTVTSVARSYNKGTYGSDNVVFYEIGAGNGSSVTIDKFLFSPSADNKVELIRFTDGVEWTINDVLQRDGCSPATTGSDSILGHRWDESFDGLDGNDLINGERGNDTVFGGAGNDTLYGGLGSDYLSGGTGNDTIYGDDGDDTYLLSSNGSHDTIYMGNGQDQIRFDTGIKPEDVSLFKNGNDLIVCINQERNQSTFINYFGGSTQLGGAIFEGGQIWTATDISSRIVRGTQNTITGTSGNDTFEVDSTDDVISEGTSNGTDLVMSSVSFSLQANIENLQLTGYLDTYGGGNDLNNQIVGNAGNNRISGASGSDTLIGGQGDDTYWVSSSPLMVSEAPSDDLIIESENAGTDTVITSTYHYTLDANVENLITESWTNSYSLVRGYGTSRTYPIPRRLTGNALDNVIDSRKWDASARIDGGLGADTMYGTRYNDTFGLFVISCGTQQSQ
ncbi:MAG: beta strand repeat-containing protein [Aquabacterium sp.]